MIGQQTEILKRASDSFSKNIFALSCLMNILSPQHTRLIISQTLPIPSSNLAYISLFENEEVRSTVTRKIYLFKLFVTVLKKRKNCDMLLNITATHTMKFCKEIQIP